MRKYIILLLALCLQLAARGQTAYYWFDNDRGSLQTATMTDGRLTVEVDLGGLTESLHALHIQVADGDGMLSAPVTRRFLKVPQTEGIDHVTLLCMIDGTLFSQEQVAMTGHQAGTIIDVSSLSQGLHQLLVLAVTPSGAVTPSYSTFFFRAPLESEVAAMRLYYTIDGDALQQQEAPRMADGFHIDVDVSTLSDGLHRLTYFLSNGVENTTTVHSAFFWKTPLGGNGITKYEYWLNDDDTDTQTVTLSERVTPLQLMQLLPVPSVPVRSSCFEFRVEQGQPVVYAKNDFHLRFTDVAGRFSMLSRQYVDESVRQEVTDATVLERNKTVSVAAPASNAIHWFTLQAEPGDSLRLQLSRAATLQLFAPSGAEVFSAQGASATSGAGIHAEENGTYYVALHDATATASTLNLTYEHIDRYAVLRQDIATVGNGGPSTITFYGNGFDELQSVELVQGTATIAAAETEADSKATVSVKWDFADVPLGQYMAVFHFADGDVTVENCISVEEPVPVSVSGKASYASLFLVSQGNTYNYKVKNHGNMTAYDMPMQLSVYATAPELLDRVSVDGTELTSFTVAETLPEGYVYGRCYVVKRSLRPNTAEPLAVKVMTSATGGIFVDMDGVGGPSEAVASLDPNDIYGYQDGEGDKTVRDGRVDVWYTIEFENDPAFATAPAHDIYVTDVLSPDLFDLSTFTPTRIKIGDREEVLSGEKNGVFTFTLQPRINAVAQVEWTLNETTGEVVWHISSLDPMTMEPATYVLDGVLPVNTDGQGIGQLSFDIQLKPNLPNGTEVPNKAVIVFDGNDPIETPTWTNVIESDVVAGDANGNGGVDIGDAVTIVNYLVGKESTTFVEKAADTNKNHQVDIGDAVTIVNFLVGKTASLSRSAKTTTDEREPQ